MGPGRVSDGLRKRGAAKRAPRAVATLPRRTVPTLPGSGNSSTKPPPAAAGVEAAAGDGGRHGGTSATPGRRAGGRPKAARLPGRCGPGRCWRQRRGSHSSAGSARSRWRTARADLAEGASGRGSRASAGKPRHFAAAGAAARAWADPCRLRDRCRCRRHARQYPEFRVKRGLPGEGVGSWHPKGSQRDETAARASRPKHSVSLASGAGLRAFSPVARFRSTFRLPVLLPR